MTNPLAQQLNEDLKKENEVVFDLLSRKGQSFYFPKGILSQSAEAKEKAHLYNATIGIATKGKLPLSLNTYDQYFNGIEGAEVSSYSPSQGNAELRKAWKERILKCNPSLADKDLSDPVVTSGLTHGLSLCSELLFDAGDKLFLPNQIWGNYKLLFDLKAGVEIVQYNFFKDNKYDLESLKSALVKETKQKKVLKILFNFPNNPTGYSLLEDEALQLKKLLLELANGGNKILTIFDDAYFGLLFEEGMFKESLFSLLAKAHKNILAVKIDGITKEYFAWGYRVGFISFGNKNLSSRGYLALEKKVAGIIRANISNCSTPAQNIILKQLKDKKTELEAKKNLSILKSRGNEVTRVLQNSKYHKYFTPYPFNAGYFMLLRLRDGLNAEEVRLKLLNEKGIGLISTSACDLRVAFSCLEKEQIEPLFDKLLELCQSMAYSDS